MVGGSSLRPAPSPQVSAQRLPLLLDMLRSAAAKPYTIASKAKSRRISSTCVRRTHYETLGLQEGASKSQIKSHFYKLSKLHHPDVSKDPESAALFRKASEAYAVLSNDRERRAYDRSLLHRPPTGSHQQAYHPRAPPTRTSRASYAWEYRPRTTPKKPSPDFPYTARSSAYSGGTFRHPIHEDVLKGSRRREEAHYREIDKIRNEMPLIRPIQLLAAMAITYGIFKIIPW